ncbi:unnamed protein product [Durusdinium trenchii]|uniref:Uncharacterized protein n=1 Tax=Durusdinium trenchii TaxID=1381693 RepID=A0ABP0JE23_9DINO
MLFLQKTVVGVSFGRRFDLIVGFMWPLTKPTQPGLSVTSASAFGAFIRSLRSVRFPGSQLPWLFIGMEYVRTNSLQLAQQCLDYARTLMPTDPRVYNELGVVAYHKRNYEEAVQLLRHAIGLCSRPDEAVHSNLGHALLKCGQPAAALEAFRHAMRLEPSSAKAAAGVAFALQLQGKLDEAINYYHRALNLDRNDVFSAEMLNYAITEALDRGNGL